MGGHGKKNVDEALLLALAAGASLAQAAHKGGCSVNTVRRRLKDAGFRARVEEQRMQMIRDAVGRLATLGKLAVAELRRLIGQGGNDGVKLGAAKAALDFMFRGAETDLLARQVEELQKQILEIKNGYAQKASGAGG